MRQTIPYNKNEYGDVLSKIKDHAGMAEHIEHRRHGPSVAEIRARHAQINLMKYISQYTTKKPSILLGSIKQF